jgi:hypothetical protein
LMEVFVVFPGGLGGNGWVDRGFLMVNLWWIRGESWLVDGRFLCSKNAPRMTDLFLGIPIRESLAAGWDA